MSRRTQILVLLTLAIAAVAVVVGALIAPHFVEQARLGRERARVESERQDLATAVATRRIAPLEAFLRERPDSPCAGEATAAIEALRRDESRYAQVAAVGTAAAIDGFLAEVPGHVREAEAKAHRAAMAPRGLSELLAAHEVEVEAHGAGITGVRLRLRRLVPWERNVTIPVGCWFVARGGHQDMIATAPASLRLDTGEPAEVVVPAACANRPRPVPGADDAFAVEPASGNPDLQRLAQGLARIGAGSAVAQAAVWIVTDDSTFEQLGRLVLSFDGGISGKRAIEGIDAATAMEVCAEAGIDVEHRAIAADAFLLVHGLASRRPEVVEWCRVRLERRGLGATPVDIVRGLLAQREADRWRSAALDVVKALGGALRPGLQELAVAPESSVRATVAEAFGRLGDAVDVERLAALARDSEVAVRIAAVRALQQMPGDERFAALKERLGDADDRVVLVALEVLRDRLDASSLPLLIALSRRGGAEGLRVHALDALGSIGGAEARAELVRQVGADDEVVCAAALRALGDAVDPVLAPVLRNQLRRPWGSFVRRQLLERFAASGAVEVADELRRLCSDGDPVVRAAAAGRLGSSVEPRDLPRLLELANDPEAQVRAAVLEVLGAFGGESVAAALLHALSDTAPEVVAAASRGIATARDPALVPGLVRALRRGGGGVERYRGLDALEAIGGSAGTNALLGLLDDADRDFRWRVASALGRCAGPEALAAVEAAMAKEPDRAVGQQLQLVWQRLRQAAAQRAR